MTEEVKMFIGMKDTYEKQIKNLKDEWENGNSRFDNIMDYHIQLNIWEKRVAQYDERISKLLS